MNTTSALQQESEDYFRQMELDYDATQSAYQHILSTIDTALVTGNYDALERLIPYIEEGDGHLAFQYIPKTPRFLRILNIILLERKYGRLPFYDNCGSVESLWEKYMLTLFAFRRLLFQFSEDSVNEAVSYLQSCPVSHFATYIILQNELLIPDQGFYETLAAVYTQTWSSEDLEQFRQLTTPA